LLFLSNPIIQIKKSDLKMEGGRMVQEKYSTSYYDLSYPGLILKISLKRKLSYHLVQVTIEIV
jgi:hypothetical protein